MSWLAVFCVPHPHTRTHMKFVNKQTLIAAAIGIVAGATLVWLITAIDKVGNKIASVVDPSLKGQA